MNTRLIGKIIIGLGVVMLLAYIGWIVFRVVRQPEQVTENGLLPNPFDLVAPRSRPPETGPTIGVAPDTTTGTTVIDIPDSPDKRLFRISQSPASSFALFQTVEDRVNINPLTGNEEKTKTPLTKIRYATRDEGFVVDAVIEAGGIKESRVSNAFLSDVYTSDTGRYITVGQYRSSSSASSTAYSLSLEKPPKVQTPTKQTTLTPECKYTLTKIKPGDKGSAVESVQQVLGLVNIVADFQLGVFDKVMKSAVIEYQKSKKITPASGLVGPKTLTQLNNDCKELLPKQEPVQEVQNNQEREQAPVTVLPRGVYSISLLDDTHIFMLMNSRGANRGIIKNIVTGEESEIYKLGFVDWRAALLNANTVLMTTKSSGKVPGYAFTVSRSSTLLVPVLSNIVGLATLPSPDGKHILYSSTEGGLPSLSLYTLDTRVVTSIDMQTFAEKCTWTNDSAAIYCLVPGALPGDYVYPDEWYKRGIDVSDGLQRYIVSDGKVESLDVSGEIPAISIDGIESAITADSEYYVFRDWKSGYIWGYRLK